MKLENLRSLNKKFRVGITGGIASGKTHATNYFRDKGYPVFFADILAAQIMNRDPEVISSIVIEFGEDSYLDGRLDREYLSKQVFGFPERVEKLNSIVHPKVILRSAELLDVALEHSDIVFYEAALIFEAGMAGRFDLVLLITANEEIRLQRAVSRGGLSGEGIRRRMISQISEEEKIRRSNFVIVNDGTLEEFEVKLEKFLTLLEEGALELNKGVPRFI